MRNPKRHSNNASGIPGIHVDRCCPRRPYRACINYNGKNMHLGRFATLEEAIEEREFAEDLFFGSFAPCNSRPQAVQARDGVEDSNLILNPSNN
jgi:hypothetical protein